MIFESSADAFLSYFCRRYCFNITYFNIGMGGGAYPFTGVYHQRAVKIA